MNKLLTLGILFFVTFVDIPMWIFWWWFGLEVLWWWASLNAKPGLWPYKPPD